MPAILLVLVTVVKMEPAEAAVTTIMSVIPVCSAAEIPVTVAQQINYAKMIPIAPTRVQPVTQAVQQVTIATIVGIMNVNRTHKLTLLIQTL
jgi:hypothetical protein